jgi:biotin carboxyl carrier protein
MPSDPVSPATEVQQALAELSRLRRFAGPPTQFWPTFIATAGALLGAVRGVLILRDKAQPENWKKLGDWSGNGHADRSVLTFTRVLTELAEQSASGLGITRPLGDSALPGAKHFAIAARLQLQQSEEVCIAAFLLLDVTPTQANEALLRLQLAADVPASYQASQVSEQAKGDVDKFASTLDLLVLVNAEQRFLAAAMALCNGLATRHRCDRVSLGWLEKGYIRLKAISRTEKFDRKMSAVLALEVAMEEAFDQDEEILWPAPEGAVVIARDHEKFARDQAAGNVVSVPLRVDNKAVAVLTCERASSPFTALEVQQLRLTADQSARRLSDLKKHDRWFGARWTTAAQEKLGKLVGPEHTGAKLLAIVISAVLLFLVLPVWPYRVEANFILRSEDVSFLTAPFEGYIREVRIRPGDALKTGDPLLALNTTDLELEEASALADWNRYQREAEKARAANQLAEMRIAEALAQQSQARLDLVRHRLQQAVIKAPFDGVLVEGDLRQRVGSPVKQGDALFKIAHTENLYVEAEVDERDVHEMLNKSSGEIAFVSQPKLKFPIKVTRLEPAAVVKKEGNVFIVRCAFVEKPASWWRPGMSGVAKISVERRSLLWVLTHRTIDFLRLKLWW